MSTPDLSPLVAAPVVCRDCSTVLKPVPIKGRRGQREVVTHLEYHCKKCSYKMQSTLMTSMEMFPVREDGTMVKLG